MPIIKRFDDSYEFMVETPETDEDIGVKTYFFVKQHVCVEEEYSEDPDYSGYNKTNYYPIIEHPTMGICFWRSEDSCWTPFDSEVQRKYSDFLAEKELLENPKPPKAKKAGSK